VQYAKTLHDSRPPNPSPGMVYATYDFYLLIKYRYRIDIAIFWQYRIDIVSNSKNQYRCITIQQLHWLPVRQRINYKLSVITYRTRSADNLAYLHHLIHDYIYQHAHCDKLLLTVPRMALALSAKAFSVSAPSVWNSLSYNCRSAKLLST